MITVVGPVAQWIRHLTTNQGVPGSSPGRVDIFFLIGKSRYVCCPQISRIFEKHSLHDYMSMNYLAVLCCYIANVS